MRAFIDLVKLKIIDDYLKEMPIKLGSEILLQDYYEQLYDVVKYIIEIPSQAGTNFYRIHGIYIDSWSPDKYKGNISSKIKSALDKLVIYCLSPPKECQSEGVEIAKKLVELYEIKKQLVKVLQQHLERNILAGECGYTTP